MCKNLVLFVIIFFFNAVSSPAFWRLPRRSIIFKLTERWHQHGVCLASKLSPRLYTTTLATTCIYYIQSTCLCLAPILRIRKSSWFSTVAVCYYNFRRKGSDFFSNQFVTAPACLISCQVCHVCVTIRFCIISYVALCRYFRALTALCYFNFDSFAFE